jgi:hypothetical protein
VGDFDGGFGGGAFEDIGFRVQGFGFRGGGARSEVRGPRSGGGRESEVRGRRGVGGESATWAAAGRARRRAARRRRDFIGNEIPF